MNKQDLVGIKHSIADWFKVNLTNVSWANKILYILEIFEDYLNITRTKEIIRFICNFSHVVPETYQWSCGAGMKIPNFVFGIWNTGSPTNAQIFYTFRNYNNSNLITQYI